MITFFTLDKFKKPDTHFCYHRKNNNLLSNKILITFVQICIERQGQLYRSNCLQLTVAINSKRIPNAYDSKTIFLYKCAYIPIRVRTFNLMSLYNFQIIKHMTELPMTSSLMRGVNRDSLAKRYFQVVFGFRKMWKMFTELI